MAVALDLISDQRFIAAGEMLNHARVLDPDHPNLPAVTRRLTIARQSVVETLKIHPTNLSGRSSTLQRQLSILGQSIVEENATITIRSSNDASARWIYQQLSQDVAQRISATMEYGAPAAIIIRCPQGLSVFRIPCGSCEILMLSAFYPIREFMLRPLFANIETRAEPRTERN